MLVYTDVTAQVDLQVVLRYCVTTPSVVVYIYR
jgi:hypothetical protein